MKFSTSPIPHGQYELIQTLGRGTYGTVYEVRDLISGQRLALKELTHHSPTALSLFKQEFRAVQSVHHPNLARLEALVEEDGRWLIAMELVEGTDLLSYIHEQDADSCTEGVFEHTLTLRTIPPVDTVLRKRTDIFCEFNESRLRHAFRQLALGLSALHRSGIVHRDLKPSNVRVTSEERVVVLDFGLVSAIDPKDQSTHNMPMGTAAYMAPEQALGIGLTSATDWYAFGVCLYEALTSELPIEEESAFKMMMVKQKSRPESPSSIVPDIPIDLENLCMELLEPDVAKRAGEEEVFSVFTEKVQRTSSRPISRLSLPARSMPFTGRKMELLELSTSLDHVLESKQRIVIIQGESGIGKSALVDYFLSQIEDKDYNPLILRSRCYENEQLAFKAFDGAVDDLTRYLTSLDPIESQNVLPSQITVLCRLFPVLAMVESIDNLAWHPLSADPTLQRLEAFSVLAKLLRRLCQTRLVILYIDDLQWADAESFRLLRALIEEPDPPPLLILATLRPEDELEGDAIDGLNTLYSFNNVKTIQLKGLSSTAARQLIQNHLETNVPDIWLQTIARESRGHPLMLTVLTRFAENHDSYLADDITLEAALNARIGNLSKKARSLLQVVSLSSKPQPIGLYISAADLKESDAGNIVAELCGQKMLRRRRANEIACYHDQIRRVVIDSIKPEHVKDIHRHLAHALATLGETDPAELGRHYDAAGESELAFNAYRLGAKNMLQALAFARSAALYKRAIEIGVQLSLDPGELTMLKVERGHALARCGHSDEAARQYLDAVENVDGVDKTRLRIWAAQHLLQSAQVKEGLCIVRALLTELGISMPRDDKTALAMLLWDRACLAISGLEANVSYTKEIPIAKRMRLDAMWGIALPLSWIDPLVGTALFTRYLRMALALGEPNHIARALAQEAGHRLLQNPQDAKADSLFERSNQLCQQINNPALEMITAFMEGTAATYRFWDTSLARKRLEDAERLGTEHCLDQPWLLSVVRTNLGIIWTDHGENARLSAHSHKWISEAREREDHFACATLEGLGMGFLRFLLNDDPDAAQDALAAAMAPWPQEPFSMTHLGELSAIAYIELYRGGSGAYHWFLKEKARLKHAFVLKVGVGQAVFWMLRTFAMLAAWFDAPKELTPMLRREIGSHLRKLQKMQFPIATQSRMLIEAQLLLVDGRRQEALTKSKQLMKADMEKRSFLHRYNTYLCGVIEGGDSGKQKCQAVLTVSEKQGWKNPKRMLASFCPVIARVE